MSWAQWVLAVISTLGVLCRIYFVIEGRPAEEPKGFWGVIGCLVNLCVTFSLLYFAGAMTHIIGGPK